MKIKSMAVATGALMLAACGGAPATIEDVENNLREDFSEDEAEVTWISVTQEGEDESDFVAVLDITDPEEEEGSRTARCDISATTISSSRTCQSIRPSIPETIRAEIEERFSGMGAEVESIDLERTDDGNLTGTAQLVDPRNGSRITQNCSAEVTDTRYEWNCNPA